LLSVPGLASAAPAAHVYSRSLVLGINDNAGTVLNWVAIRAHHPERTGARVLRTGIFWSIAEPRAGRFHWDSFDRLFKLEAQRGLKLLPVLIGTPTWAGATASVIPGHPGAFARFAAAVASRYGPNGSFWREHPALDSRLAAAWLDVWNEPYINAYNNFDPDPARYARLVRAVGVAVHRANPAERLLMETNTYSEAPTGQLQGGWIAQLYRAVPDLNRYFDAASVHPYCASPLLSLSQTIVSCERVATIHQQLAAHGADDKPMWITEFGWSTCNDGGGTYPGCVSYKDQANFLRIALRNFSAKPYVAALFPYCYQNMRFPKAGIIDTYGLLDWNGKRKPAYSVWRTFVDQPGGPNR
jgi:hypothetical protein